MREDRETKRALRLTLGVLSGLLAGFTALAVAQLVAVPVRPEAAPLNAVGDAVIELSPPSVTQFGVDTFRSNNKLVLEIGTLSVLALFALRRRRLASGGVLLFGVIEDIELTTFDAYDAYWVRRNWAKKAPIKTQSRIDTPKPFASLPAGKVPVAGVAWAQHRGIGRVEVPVDGGAWHEARLGAEATEDTWRQWVWEWSATTGSHTLEVRATDGEGDTQTGKRAGTVPDGATGRHSVVVDVS